MRVLIIFALLGAAAAAKNAPQRIVGGSPTTVENYPYMSNMQYFWRNLWFLQWCGGSLITTHTVLSAAHCYEGDHPSEWRVLLGTSESVTGGSEHGVAQILVHSDFRIATLDHDIAIIRLATPAVYSNSVGAVSIAGPNYIIPDGTQVTAAGWGALFEGGWNAEQLKHVDINTVNWEYCRQRYAYLQTVPGYQHWPDVTTNMLCTGIQDIGGKDSCQGDAGGPLVHRSGGVHVLIGILSWRYECGHPEYPSVNVAVNRHTDWIVANA